MKSAYVICVLLGITIGSLVLAEGIAETIIKTQTSTSPLPSSTVKPQQMDNELTTPEPNTTTPTTISTVTSSSTTATPNTTTPTPTKTSTSTTTTSKSTITTVMPITSTNATTSSTTISTSTSAVKTTAEPPSTPSPSKERHFDGLSFFGGIILATCLMAIATFSWKFYRQCNERNYRTL